jgi:spore coat polysaccharide biosynthesis protein SpsF (cytidylyltransferase family)
MKTAIFLSVRDKATRLPGKVRAKIQGRTAIEHLIDRLKMARLPDLLVMTTSTHPDDTRLVEIAEENGIEWFRGSQEDKLQRYLDAAGKYDVEFATVVDGDDLFCDPVCIDRIIAAYREAKADYITCTDLPLGVTAFGIRMEALQEVCRLKAQRDTEVWGGYFTQSGLFKTLSLEVEQRYRHPELRMTLDYPEDLRFFEAVFERLYQPGKVFSLDEIIRCLEENPQIAALNKEAQERYLHHLKKAAPVELKSEHAGS